MAAWLVLHHHPAVAQDGQRAMVPVSIEHSAPQPVEDATDDTDVHDGADGILELADRSLEDLVRQDVVVPAMDMEVSTVSRTTSTVGRSPAAVFVITNEMIRRSGATNIPDLLRMVPGLQVARIDANKWAVSSRGFNGRFANKLQVQIDGRTAYTPLFAGVYWSEFDTLLDDIERIEVIRGPGATVWGANAVNGVINIITKNAHDTQGVYVKVGGGTEERDFASLRYGGTIGERLSYRIYGKHFNRDAAFSPLGAHDGWDFRRAGFRMDWDADPCGIDHVTFQGDYHDGRTGITQTVPTPGFPFQQAVTEDLSKSGGNLLARWTHTYSEDSDTSLQFFYDHSGFTAAAGGHHQDVYDIDFQHRFRCASRHRIVWGLGYRSVEICQVPAFTLALDPSDRRTDLYSAFFQDRVTLLEDELLFTVGCKAEHNDFTGGEFQPTARLVWSPTPRASGWAAISRAVRTPSFVESHNGRLLLPPVIPNTPTWPMLLANPNMLSEELLAYELGYRAQPSETFYWDLALFYNVYERLQSFRYVNDPLVDPLTLQIGNDMNGETYGVELACSWEVTPRWRLSGHYAYL